MSERKLDPAATKICPSCNGTGVYLFHDDAPGECSSCNGTGRVRPDFYGDDPECNALLIDAPK